MNNNMRPTPEQIAEARDRFDYLSFDKESVRELEQKLDSILGKDATKHIRVLLAAIEPQDDIPIERRNHFRMTPHRRPNGPVFCVDQRGNGEFDVYFEHQDKFVWSSFQLYQFAQWARQAWNKT